MRLAAALPLLLVATAAAQVPYAYLVSGERTGGTSEGVILIDPVTGVSTPVNGSQGQSTLREVLTLAADPNDAGTLYVNGDVGVLLGGDVWPLALAGNKHAPLTRWRPTGMPASAFPFRFELAGKFILMTIQGGSNNGLYEIDIANRSVRQLAVTLPSLAGDIKVIGSKAYVSSDAAASTIVEWDLAAQTARTVGQAYPNLKSLGVRNGKLLAGDANGDIHFIDTGSGQANVFVSTGKGAIEAMATSPTGGIVYFAVKSASGYEIYAHNRLATPLYTTPNAIRDLDIGVANLPSLLRFGLGCKTAASTTPTCDYVNAPKLGTTFHLKLVGTKPVTPTLFLFGTSRQKLGSLPLPLDLAGAGMPTCTLYSDILTPFATTSSASGEAMLGLGIPNVAGLVGVHFTGQWLSRDTAANAAGWVVSDGLEGIVR